MSVAEFVDDVAEHFDHHLAANPLIQRWNKLEACVLGAAVNGAKAEGNARSPPPPIPVVVDSSQCTVSG